MVHSARLGRDDRWSFQDEVLDGLDETQMRCLLKGLPHSVVWALWHITRIEDATMNLLLADTRQVLHTGNWLDKLETPYQGVGNELSRDEIVHVSETVNIPALLAYRQMVGKRTVAIFKELDPVILRARPTPERLNRLCVEGAVSDQAIWLVRYWGRHPAANLLLMPATRHPFSHLNEIQRMRTKLMAMQLDLTGFRNCSVQESIA